MLPLTSLCWLPQRQRGMEYSHANERTNVASVVYNAFNTIFVDKNRRALLFRRKHHAVCRCM